MARVYDNQDLDWKGNRLGAAGGPRLIELVPDRKQPTLWRVREYPTGDTSARMNIVRAREHARRRALKILNHQETPSEAPSACLALGG